jgi:hypothetical protein|tara:strand:- start:371 stop:721 length:351 start_codon:yes stop_codon:yes gene_type:complete
MPHPVTNDMPVLLNERAIARSVRNIVETIPTEKFFDPLFGSNVRGMLFENYTQTTSYIIEDQIKTSIRNYEPRVNNIRTIVQGKPDLNAFEVTVVFDIVGLEVPRQSFTFLLEPTR